jgi:hypothetical protein
MPTHSSQPCALGCDLLSGLLLSRLQPVSVAAQIVGAGVRRRLGCRLWRDDRWRLPAPLLAPALGWPAAPVSNATTYDDDQRQHP